MLFRATALRPIYSQDCDCGDLHALCSVECFGSDVEAARAFAQHEANYKAYDDGHALDNRWRYWIVHGPGGHVIAVR